MEDLSSLALQGVTRLDALDLRELAGELDQPAEPSLVTVSDAVVDEAKHGDEFSPRWSWSGCPCRDCGSWPAG